MKNFFKYRWKISRIGVILIIIGFFLSLVSFIKGIQILLFIPALVISLFLFSFFEVRKLKKSLKCNLLKEHEDYIISVRSPENLNFFFRIAYSDSSWIHLLSPDIETERFSLLQSEDIEIILFIKWTFDILRHVVKIWKIAHGGDSQKDSEAPDLRDGTFFLVREYEPGDNPRRLDSLKSALKNFPFIKTILNSETSKNPRKKGLNELTLHIDSNRIVLPKDDSRKWTLLKWLLILIDFTVIFIEWENIALDAMIMVPIVIVSLLLLKKKKFSSPRLLNLVILAFFANMIAMAIFTRDMTWPGSVFLTQILIIKQLYSDDREDGFLYIFLSMFVFVAVSLFSVELWFILFFLIYLVISVFLLTSVSGYMVTDSLKWAYTTRFSNLRTLRITWLIFIMMVFLFFILPHWNVRWNTQSNTSPNNAENLSWFSNELDFKNAWAIKTDNSKVMAVDNLRDADSELLKRKYWRWERFYMFRNNSWIKTDDSRSYFMNRNKSAQGLKVLNITYFPKGSSSLFMPAIPESVDLGMNSSDIIIRQKQWDNSIFYLASKIRKTFNLSASFDVSDSGIFLNQKIEYSSFTWSVIDKQTNDLMDEFWSKIDPNIYDTPAKLTDYVKNIYGFSYSIEAPAKDLHDFLYGSKKWYCEYYATVLALTLQHFWYDATLVNWYYSWEWNNLAKSWVIRWKDAHSWVEVYNRKNWQILDATPNLLDYEIPAYQRIWNHTVSIYDYLDLKWYAYIVNYTWDAQRELILSILSHKIEALRLFLAIIIMILLKIFHGRYRANKLLSYEEKLLRFIRGKSKSAFPLDLIPATEQSLPQETRISIYGKEHLTREKYLNLKSRWNRHFSRLK
ncbi:MAG: hypothetical protein ACD_2C00210G0010 [uncultured bacterium (gcode 4)]|uniref:Transglutaminase-like domain-containing protein n=1 Tax=uncultured bacterium (gcode 4) TaxID=1234023 RepID=K2G4E4_9BACT|nr:MAG: hypothetical protein ACD_2C00210G0010 [uncultured bacterium (gcode 4)]